MDIFLGAANAPQSPDIWMTMKIKQSAKNSIYRDDQLKISD